jgi:hypothetical protein
MTKISCLVLIFILCLCFQGHLLGQNRVEILVSSADGSALPGAQVVMKGSGPELAEISDTTGHCRFVLPAGKYRLNIRFLGFEEYSGSIDIQHHVRLTVSLQYKIVQGQEVVIYGKQPDQNVKSTDIGVTSLQQSEIKSLPKLIGETDAIKILQYTPGVALTGEGNSGIYVRGGANDQNLVLLDDAMVFNSAHLLGIFSVFNTDVIRSVKLYKSGIPSLYGGRISSVLNIETTDGNNHRFEGQGTVGIISSKLFLTGPVYREKGSFYLSARKCYLNALLEPVSKLIIKKGHLVFQGMGYDFYDINAGVSYHLSANDQLHLTFYKGSDKFDMNREDDISLENSIQWGNLASSLRWQHIFGPNTFFMLSISYSRYNFDFSMKQDISEFNLESNIDALSCKAQVARYSGKHQLKAGIQTTKFYTVPNNRNADIEQIELKYDFQNQYRHYEYAAFIQDEIDMTDRWKIMLGYRHSLYQLKGPYKDFVYDEQGVATDSTVYTRQQSVVFYHYPEIRIALRYLLRNNWSLKSAFNTTGQYLNQVPTSTVSLPSDFWIPSTQHIRPQHSMQVSLGAYKNFRENVYETSVEAFFKTMANQLEFYNSIFNTKDIENFEDNFISGKGKAFGVELFVKKIQGKTTGWISYTFSRTFRYFDEINNGARFPAKYDRIHDGSIVISHTLNSKWQLSAVFIYATGEAFTVPVARYIIQGNLVNQYGDYNGYRLPAYHRLDVSATWKLRQTGQIHSELNFSVYNVYNRQNPIFIYNSTKGNLDKYQLNVTPKQLSLLPVLPSVSWTVTF